MTEHPIHKVLKERLEKFDFEDGDIVEFERDVISDIDKLIEEERRNPGPQEPDTEGTVCRHWKGQEKVCKLGFDDCVDCYCYIPRIIKERSKAGP